jgi:hypothetical protein
LLAAKPPSTDVKQRLSRELSQAATWLNQVFGRVTKNFRKKINFLLIKKKPDDSKDWHLAIRLCLARIEYT